MLHAHARPSVNLNRDNNDSPAAAPWLLTTQNVLAVYHDRRGFLSNAPIRKPSSVQACPSTSTMDPLSVTLAVISLVTAARDIVEFGKKIHESFSKASKSLRTAKGLAEDIKEMLDDLAEFCEQNRDVLESSADFRTALKDLLVKLKGFERSVIPLLPSQETSRRSFIRGWDTWRKSDVIETSTQELKHDVKKVVRRYMMASCAPPTDLCNACAGTNHFRPGVCPASGGCLRVVYGQTLHSASLVDFCVMRHQPRRLTRPGIAFANQAGTALRWVFMFGCASQHCA
ncbi:hypothetical protein D9619_004386 [Psilocybe cf. subviscida]|uniref:Uncharacterized protein n=1 Tax=Psilocybe cf. subviscida TaxID=2480587 RepID=A0A8H5F974_9AGAR|nr:hypothetical protein D9619_004386 [Psilocybe cf. subviscida]